MKRISFVISLILIFLMTLTNAFAEDAKPSEGQKLLYHAGPWRGKVIDAETNKPIEGAIAAAIWYRDYDTRFTLFTNLHEAKEVLTDKDGYFEIPAYTETGEAKDSWQKPQLQGVEFFIAGPIIRDPEFIIYKPAFNHYPMQVEFLIFATGPSTVEYEELNTMRRKTKDFPEGLIYTGFRCFPVMERLSKKVNFRFESVFYPFDNAKEKIKQLDIPLNCPKKGEAVPIFLPGHKYEIENPLKKGGFIVIGLSKTVTDEERLKAVPKEPMHATAEKLPILYRTISEERGKVSLIIKEKEEKKKKEKK